MEIGAMIIALIRYVISLPSLITADIAAFILPRWHFQVFYRLTQTGVNILPCLTMGLPHTMRWVDTFAYGGMGARSLAAETLRYADTEATTPHGYDT